MKTVEVVDVGNISDQIFEFLPPTSDMWVEFNL